MEEMNEFFEEPYEQNISSPAEQQAFDNSQTELAEDAVKIQNLVQSGLLNPQQGQYYMSQLAKKSMERLAQDSYIPQANPLAAFEEFEKEKPDFFRTEGRADVLNYLKNSNVLVDKDEIGIISQMVEKLEQCAIDRYVKQQAHEKALNDENEAAKRKLTANAQNASFSGNKNKAFTREQIGRMSGAEFTKYEPLIMDQLRKGLIH